MNRYLATGNPPITGLEHRAFFVVASVPLLIRLFELALALLFPEQPQPGIKFAIYSIFDRWDLVGPIYSFVAFLLIVPLAHKLEITNLILSLFPLSLLTFFYDYWFVDSQIRVRQILEVNPNYDFKSLDFIMIWSSVYDVISLLLVNILLVWHLSLLYRLISANRQSRLS